MALKIYTLTNLEDAASIITSQHLHGIDTTSFTLTEGRFWTESSATQVCFSANVNAGSVAWFSVNVRDSLNNESYLYCLRPSSIVLSDMSQINVSRTHQWVKAVRRQTGWDEFGTPSYAMVEEPCEAPRIAIDDEVINGNIEYSQPQEFWPAWQQISSSRADFYSNAPDLLSIVIAHNDELNLSEFNASQLKVLDLTKLPEYVEYINNLSNSSYSNHHLSCVLWEDYYEPEWSSWGSRRTGSWDINFRGDNKIVFADFYYSYRSELEQEINKRYRIYLTEGSYYNYETGMQDYIYPEQVGKIEMYDGAMWVESTLESTKILFSPLAMNYPYASEDGTIRGAHIEFASTQTKTLDGKTYSFDYIDSMPPYHSMEEKSLYDVAIQEFCRILATDTEPSEPSNPGDPSNPSDYTTSDLLNDIAKIIQTAEGDTSKKIQGKDLAVRLQGVINNGGCGNTPSSTNTLKKLLDFTKSADRMFAARRDGEDSYVTDISNYLQYNDTENVESMIEMFSGCNRLTSVNINTNSLRYAAAMFARCQALTQAPAITSSLYEATSMFYGCNALTQIEALNLSNATEIQSIFSQCYNLTSIPRLDTSRVYMWTSAFRECNKLSTIDISRYYCDSEWHADEICYNCHSLTSFIIREIGSQYVLSYNSFSGCYHLNGTTDATYNPDGDRDGYIFVPQHMVSTLRTTSNWSQYGDRLRALEKYTVDGTTKGDLDPIKLQGVEYDY